MKGDLKHRFGKRIQELREAKAITQEQLAERIGRSVDTIGNIERGVNATRIETAYQLAIELGVSLPELFTFNEETEPAARERQRAIASISRLLTDLDPMTFEHLRSLIDTGVALARLTKV